MKVNNKNKPILIRYNNVLQTISDDTLISTIADKFELSLPIANRILNGLVHAGLAVMNQLPQGNYNIPTNHYKRICNAEFTVEMYAAYNKHILDSKAKKDINPEALTWPTIQGGTIIRFSEANLNKRYREQMALYEDDKRKHYQIEVRRGSTLS